MNPSLYELASLDSGQSESVLEMFDETSLDLLEQRLTDLWPLLDYETDLELGDTRDPFSQFVNRVPDATLWPAACVSIGQEWLLKYDDDFSSEVEQLVEDCRMKAMWVLDSDFGDQFWTLRNEIEKLEMGKINPADVMLIDADLFRPKYLMKMGRELIDQRRFTEAFFRLVTAGEVALREWGWIRAFGLGSPHRFNNVKSKFAKKAMACGYRVEDLAGWEEFSDVYELRSTQVFHGQREVTSAEAAEAEQCVNDLLEALPVWLGQQQAGFTVNVLSDHVAWRDLSGLLLERLQSDLDDALGRVHDLARECRVKSISPHNYISGVVGWEDLAYGLPPDMDEYLMAGIVDMARFLFLEAQSDISDAFDASSILLEALGRRAQE